MPVLAHFCTLHRHDSAGSIEAASLAGGYGNGFPETRKTGQLKALKVSVV